MELDMEEEREREEQAKKDEENIPDATIEKANDSYLKSIETDLEDIAPETKQNDILKPTSTIKLDDVSEDDKFFDDFFDD